MREDQEVGTPPQCSGGPSGRLPLGVYILAEWKRCPVCNDSPDKEIWHDTEKGCPRAMTARSAPEGLPEGSP